MTTWADQLLEQELADTLQAARRRHGRPVPEREGTTRAKATLPAFRARRGASPSRSDTRLARDLIGHPTPPRHGVCRFCGAPAPNRTVCTAHSDLPQLDPTTGVHATTATTGRLLNEGGVDTPRVTPPSLRKPA